MTEQQIKMVTVGNISAPPSKNVRADAGDLSELVTSIKAVGIIEPLIVRIHDDKLALVAGSRRLAAAKKAGLKTVPVIVRTLTDQEAQEIQLVENLQRLDLTALEEAAGYRTLVEAHGYTQRQLAERIGRGQSHISKRLALLDLPAPAIKALAAGKIDITAAASMAKLDEANAAAALKEGGRWGADRMSQQVQRAAENKTREQQYEADFAAAVAEAEKDPAPYLPSRVDQYGRASLPPGAVPLSPRGGYHELGIKQSDHKKLACHAVTVLARGHAAPKLTYICTDPIKAHPAEAKKAELVRGATGKMSEAEKKRRGVIREHSKALKEAAAARRGHLHTILKRAIGPADALEALVGTYLSGQDHLYGGTSEERHACELLALDTPEKTNAYESEAKTRQVLGAYAVKSKANIARVAVALSAGHAERIIEAMPQSGWNTAPVLAHFAMLKAKGYKTTAAERLELEGKGPR